MSRYVWGRRVWRMVSTSSTADYIFYETDQLRVRQVVPLPEETEVAGTALPSARFPSDHLSLCCDLEWIAPAAAPPASAVPEQFRYPARMKQRRRLPQPASPHLVYKGAVALRAGGVIALPTDTVYGLAAAAHDAEGVKRLYEVSEATL